jgi:hypothetical protein
MQGRTHYEYSFLKIFFILKNRLYFHKKNIDKLE